MCLTEGGNEYRPPFLVLKAEGEEVGKLISLYNWEERFLREELRGRELILPPCRSGLPLKGAAERCLVLWHLLLSQMEGIGQADMRHNLFALLPKTARGYPPAVPSAGA